MRIAVIPARGGSKGILKKNIVRLGNKPLIAYTIKEAIKSNLSRVIVTTDSNEIAKISTDNGAEVPFKRPIELAQDKSNSIDVAIHSIKEMEKLEEEDRKKEEKERKKKEDEDEKLRLERNRIEENHKAQIDMLLEKVGNTTITNNNTNNNVLPRVFFLSSEYDEFVFRAKRDRLFLRRRDDDVDYCE